MGRSRDVYHSSVNRNKNFTTYGDHAHIEGNHNVTSTFMAVASFSESTSFNSFRKHIVMACRVCQYKTYILIQFTGVVCTSHMVLKNLSAAAQIVLYPDV